MKKKLAVTLTSSALLAGQLAAQDREAIRGQLAGILPAEKAEPAMSAMCYEIAVAPERFEYICPVCGERSFRIEGEGVISEMELVSCRRLWRELPSRERFTLDESGFCRKCRPAAAKPELILQVRYDDGRTEAVHGVHPGVLKLLAEVLRGRSRADSAEVRQSELKALTRISELVAVVESEGTRRESQP